MDLLIAVFVVPLALAITWAGFMWLLSKPSKSQRVRWPDNDEH